MENLLTSRPIPELNQELLAKFTPDLLHATRSGRFDLSSALKVLDEATGKKVMAVDIGANKLAISEFLIDDGKLSEDSHFQSPRSQSGAGYMADIVKAADKAQRENLATGISYAGPVEGDKPIVVNVPELIHDLKMYGGTFKGTAANPLFGDNLKALDNDAVAGLRASAIEAKRQHPQIKNVIYLIVGSGINGAVLANGDLMAVEAGHLPVPAQLNPFHRTVPCTIFGRTETCVEKVGGGKLGIEATWTEINGHVLSAPEIQDLADNGDKEASSLYDNSAIIAANMIVGLAQALDVPLNSTETAVACHGGIFNHDSYRSRIVQLLETWGYEVPFIFTRDFSDNACLDGAAIAALTASS